MMAGELTRLGPGDRWDSDRLQPVPGRVISGGVPMN